MTAAFKEGDRVQVAERVAGDADIKSGLYYNHFHHIQGVVQKVYDANEIAIEVDTASLQEEIRVRHEQVREQMKSRWLEGLSEEARGKLTEAERNFKLRYTVLVAASDVQEVGAAPPPARKTTEEIAAAEAEYLASRQAADSEQA